MPVRSTRTIRLSDDRRLAWHEFGDPAGTPCVYLAGTPSSGLAGRAYHAQAAAAAVRLIALDRPGYGDSDFASRRQPLDTAADVAQLADHLDLTRFAVFAESGGSPHALATAHVLGERVTAVAIVAGIGPLDRAGLRAMRPANRRLIRIARRAPWLLRVVFADTRRKLRDPERAARYLKTVLAAAPPADRAAVAADPEQASIGLEATADALRPGTRGVAQELRMFTRPWGFALSDVNVTVGLWHGHDDGNVPLAIAEQVASALPTCEKTILPNAGHNLVNAVRRDVFAFIARTGQPSPVEEVAKLPG